MFCRSGSSSGGAALAGAAAPSAGAVVPSGINPYTMRPFSQRYLEILEGRKKLPVMEYKEKFREIITSTQCMVLVGETGSGKTTQVRV